MTETLSRSGRRAEHRRERRRQQVRRIGLALGVLALLAIGFAVYLAVDAPAPPSTPQPSEQVRTQRTLLLQVQAPNGAAVASAVLAHDELTGTGAAVLVPPQVLVEVAGTGSVPFGRALAAEPPAAVRDALSDLMGVTIDDTWVLAGPTLAALVDALGGVSVEVDVPVTQGATVLLSPGPQVATGAQALALLSFSAAGEQEQARLARLQEVLDGLVNALPATPAELTTVLRGLGELSRTSADLPALAGLLVGLASDDEQGRLQYDVLPVVDQQAGGDVVSFRTDAAATTALVGRLLAGSVPEGVREGGNRVLVLNGVGTPGLGESVRGKLVGAGLVFAGSDNAPTFDYAKTQVLVPERTAEGQALGERVAKALGLPALQIGSQDFGTSADVIVIVGRDYRP